jgi:hypothetical protein
MHYIVPAICERVFPGKVDPLLKEIMTITINNHNSNFVVNLLLKKFSKNTTLTLHKMTLLKNCRNLFGLDAELIRSILLKVKNYLNHTSQKIRGIA